MAVLASIAVGALEMRVPVPITTPGALAGDIGDEIVRACEPMPCDGLVQLTEVVPVGARTVRAAVGRLAGAWNTGGLDAHLGDSFFDRTRLLDTLREVVPRDARLRVLSVSNIQTLAQYLQPAAGGRGDIRVSMVRATVTTQVEFNDPAAGFVRSRRDQQEYLLVIAEGGEN